MNIVTGYRGTPHITAQQDRDINLGLVGNSLTDAYVLDVGQKLEADIVSANEVRVRDGVVILQGCAGVIDSGAYDSLTITNGTQGMLRTDIIAVEYSKAADTNIESLTLVVVEGTPDDSDPQPPALTGGSIQNGDNLVQVPLYYVNIDGVSIDSVTPMFIDTKSLKGIMDYIEADYGYGNVLWSGANYMAANITLTGGTVSEQHKGIVLCWSAYENGQAKDYDFVYHFVPKYHVLNFSGYGVNFFLNTLSRAGHKYLYIYDDHINGYSSNDSASTTGSVSKIVYTNTYWVLRAVIGV